MDINEIARRAGVSRATVSRYLNDGYVSQEKRRLIQRIIEETGYVPSQNAQHLRTGKTHLIGVIIPKINSQSVSRMVAGITDTLAANRYHMVLANTNNDASLEIDYLNIFCGRHHVDGIILMATVLTEVHRHIFENVSIPIVVIGQKVEGCSCVYHDDYGAVRDITSLVLPQAHTPAYLGVLEEDVAVGHLRHQGFLDACDAAGIEVRPEAQLVVGFDADSGFFGAEEILTRVPDVDTIVCATDTIAFGAMMCMREFGRRVPEDVQITGVGDSLLSQIIHPSLSTVHLTYKTCGIEAARLLLSQLDTGDKGISQIKLGYQVYGRNSIR